MKGIHIAYLLLIALLTVQLACSSHSDSDDEGADAGDTHSGDTGASDTPPDPRIGGDGDNPSDLGDAGNTEDGGGGDRGETVDIPVTPDDVNWDSDPEGTPVPCDLDGLWNAVFGGTDWGDVHVTFDQEGNTYTGVGDGIDTDEGPLTVHLEGTIDGSEFGGPYVNDHHWNPGEVDFIGEIDGVCYENELRGIWQSCTYETAVDDVCVNYQWHGQFRATRPESTDINIDGCVAAVEAMCDAAGVCVSDYPLLAGVEALQDCETTMTDNASRVETTCTQYLTAGVENEEPMALYLNSANTAHIESCVMGQNCDRDFLIAVGGALAAYLESGDSSDLNALLASLLADCFLD